MASRRIVKEKTRRLFCLLISCHPWTHVICHSPFIARSLNMTSRVRSGRPAWTPVKLVGIEMSGPDAAASASAIPACMSPNSAECIWVHDRACCEDLALRGSVSANVPYVSCGPAFAVGLRTLEGQDQNSWCYQGWKMMKLRRALMPFAALAGGKAVRTSVTDSPKAL